MKEKKPSLNSPKNFHLKQENSSFYIKILYNIILPSVHGFPKKKENQIYIYMYYTLNYPISPPPVKINLDSKMRIKRIKNVQ